MTAIAVDRSAKAEMADARDRARALRRKQAWLEAHPCACGNPSTTVKHEVGTGEVKWDGGAERLARVLAHKQAICAECKTKHASGLNSRKAVYSRDRRASISAAKPPLLPVQISAPEPIPAPEPPSPPVRASAPEPIPAPEHALPSAQSPVPEQAVSGKRQKRKGEPSPWSALSLLDTVRSREERQEWRNQRRSRLGYGRSEKSS